MHTLETKGSGRMAEQARLLGIENDREITKETDSQFLFEYQRAVLLTLKDKGVLTEIQYQYAEEKLKKQLNIF
nr:hypothetical protein [uncultured Oscillibacter sp.]